MYNFKKRLNQVKVYGRKNNGRVQALIIVFLFLSFSGCKKHDHPNENGKTLDLKLVASNFVSPVSVVEAPDDSKRLFVVDQVGKIWILDKNWNKLSTPFIDLTSRMVPLMPGYDERGLLGLAFHPNFKYNRKFYIFYNAPPKAGGPQPGVAWDNTVRISEFQASGVNPNVADLGSGRIILEVNHPQFNHNGGTIAFGPDGFLY
ncbi:MAG TPA: PQQ-dependent sugar dehydrogenase, partial [Flavisolibacter sp.]|nr:PQQ-dependent sugar dehydrogenase [Flavisolibacter sp.]